MSLDLNTLLTAILIGMSSWTLYTLHTLAKAAAVGEERSKENRKRIIDLERDVGDLKTDVALLNPPPAPRPRR